MIYILYALIYAVTMFVTSYAVMAAFILIQGEVTKDEQEQNHCIAFWCGILWPIVWIFAAMCAASAAFMALIAAAPLLGCYVAGKMHESEGA